MNYKLNADQEIVKSLDRKEKVIDKRKTKGMFDPTHKNNSGHWLVDKDW